MVRNTILAAVVGFMAVGTAVAQPACPCAGGNRVIGPALTNLLAGRTACAVLGSEKWQEFHQGATAAGGNLIDWKLGAAPEAPEVVGTWSIVGLGAGGGLPRARYDYGSGGAFEYAVCQEGANTVHFCGAALGGRDITNAFMVNGQAGCPGFAAPSARTRP